MFLLFHLQNHGQTEKRGTVLEQQKEKILRNNLSYCPSLTKVKLERGEVTISYFKTTLWKLMPWKLDLQGEMSLHQAFPKAQIFGTSLIFIGPIWPTVSFLISMQKFLSVKSEFLSWNTMLQYLEMCWQHGLNTHGRKKGGLTKQLCEMSSSYVNPGSFPWMILNCNIRPFPSAIPYCTNASEFTEFITADYNI